MYMRDLVCFVRDLVCFVFALAVGSNLETCAHTVHEKYLSPFKVSKCVMSVCCTLLL